MLLGAELGNFVWRGQIATLIYLSKQPPTHTHIHMLFFITYTHTSLFDKLYIYTHTHIHLTKKKEKSLVFLIKIMFDGNLS